MKYSKIGWTDHTWNPWWGCHKVSPGCKHCYIGSIMWRSGNIPFEGPIRTSESNWRNPQKWNRAATDKRLRIFTCSMSDFFHPDADEWRADAWEVIHSCENLDWLILTKRPELIADQLPADWQRGYPNVWLGVTVDESQEQVTRIDTLSRIPAAIRFVSAEPLLGPIRFGHRIQFINWVITGCERAHKDKRRTMEDDWVRDIRDECDVASIPLFFKQYYSGTKLVFDGLIDDQRYQAWPQP